MLNTVLKSAAVSTQLENLNYEPVVQGFTGQDPWAYADFGVGIAMGTYNRLINQSYNRNCYSQIWGFVMSTMPDSQLYDRGIGNLDQWWGMPMFVVTQVFKAIELGTVGTNCFVDYRQARRSKWYTHYNLGDYEADYNPIIFDPNFDFTENADLLRPDGGKEDDPFSEGGAQEEEEEGGSFGGFDLPGWLEWTQHPTFILILDLWTLFSNVTSSIQLIQDTGYYFFFTGLTIGATFVDSIVLADRYLGFINLQQIPQWKRFAGVPTQTSPDLSIEGTAIEILDQMVEDAGEETLPVTEDVTEGIIF